MLKTEHPLYSTWLYVRSKCRNPKDKQYKYYGARGIDVHQDFYESLEKFTNELGDKPDSENYWTVGRIDNNLGYTYKNIRWETMALQARNHSLQSNNTTGIVGVQLKSKKHEHNGNTTYFEYYSADWYELDGTRKYKTFSVKKYGKAQAFQLACEHRSAQIDRLNALGAGYAESHGSPK